MKQIPHLSVYDSEAGMARAGRVPLIRLAVWLTAACLLPSCWRPVAPTIMAASVDTPANPARLRREIRITCTVQAIRSFRIVVPQIQGQMSTMTLTQLVPNGSSVKEGDLIATFDPTLQMDAARETLAKFQDLGHQVEQKIAENRANAEKRTAELRQAEANLAKAELALSKGAVLSQIERQKNEVRAVGARAHLASLRKSMALREKSDAAALRILELQRDRQKIAMRRAQDNIEKLELHATQSGMLAHEFTYRGRAFGPAQVGDQLYRGYPLASLFDPSAMQVRCSVGEADLLALKEGGAATVYPDAYPDLALPARLVYASPVASSPLGTPIKTFVAVFDIDKRDPHLLPGLSAAVALKTPRGPSGAGGGP